MNNEYVQLREGITHHCPAGRINNRVSLVQYVGNEGQARLAYDLHGCKWWNVSDLKVIKLSLKQIDAANWLALRSPGKWFEFWEIPYHHRTVESLIFRGILEHKLRDGRSVVRFGLL